MNNLDDMRRFFGPDGFPLRFDSWDPALPADQAPQEFKTERLAEFWESEKAMGKTKELRQRTIEMPSRCPLPPSDNPDSIAMFKFNSAARGHDDRVDALAFALAIRRFAPLRPSRWTRFKSWLCSRVKACKSWRLGRCYGTGLRRSIKLFIRNLFL